MWEKRRKNNTAASSPSKVSWQTTPSFAVQNWSQKWSPAQCCCHWCHCRPFSRSRVTQDRAQPTWASALKSLTSNLPMLEELIWNQLISSSPSFERLITFLFPQPSFLEYFQCVLLQDKSGVAKQTPRCQIQGRWAQCWAGQVVPLGPTSSTQILVLEWERPRLWIHSTLFADLMAAKAINSENNQQHKASKKGKKKTMEFYYLHERRQMNITKLLMGRDQRATILCEHRISLTILRRPADVLGK